MKRMTDGRWPVLMVALGICACGKDAGWRVADAGADQGARPDITRPRPEVGSLPSPDTGKVADTALDLNVAVDSAVANTAADSAVANTAADSAVANTAADGAVATADLNDGPVLPVDASPDRPIDTAGLDSSPEVGPEGGSPSDVREADAPVSNDGAADRPGPLAQDSAVDAGARDATADGDEAGSSTGARRIPLPCVAPLPTGFCLVSDPGDFIGGGQSSTGGSGSVSGREYTDNSYTFALDSLNQNWDVEFAPPKGKLLAPGLYEGMQRFPFQADTAPGFDLYGNGRGCNTLTGKFSIEEFAHDPRQGMTRFSATFEQHCEGGTAALRGVVNLNATGTPDPTPTPDKVLALSGKIFRVAYDGTSDVAYGLDATNRKLAKINLNSGSVSYATASQTPYDACVDAKRGRLFVVNKGASTITEYATSDLTAVRDIPWTGQARTASDPGFKIACASNRLYLVDGADSPGLFVVDGLDGDTPQATDVSAKVAGVGGLVLSSDAKTLFYYQDEWSAGRSTPYVARVDASTLTEIEKSNPALVLLPRDPADAPILIDETRGLVLVKNRIFDASDLHTVLYTLPGAFDQFDPSAENAYALASAQGLMATKNYIYELSRYDTLAPVMILSPDQMFFDSTGRLWLLSTASGTLTAQSVVR